MFCPKCGKEVSGSTTFCPSCGAQLTKAEAKEETRAAEAAISPKSRLATSLLAFFIGGFGAHRFYIGKIRTAIAMLFLWILGAVEKWVTVWGSRGSVAFFAIVSIWALIDFIFAVSGNMKDSNGKPIKNW